MSTLRSRRVVVALIVVSLALGAVALVTSRGPEPVDTPGPAAAVAPWERPGYFNTGVPGDVDGDREVSPDEKAVLDEAEATSSEVVASGIAATKGVETVLVTPSGEDWWTFVTAQAPDLALSGSPAPEGVDWYAFTEGRTYRPESQWLTRYSAVHLVFSTTDALNAWYDLNAASGVASGVTMSPRGRVLTITPVWVDVSTEPYGPVDELAASGRTVSIGLWRVNYAEQFANQMTEVVDPTAYRDVQDALGFGAATSWEATSPRPDVAWTGPLAGFDAEQVDGFDVIGAINSSTYDCVDGTHECRSKGAGDGSSGISEAISTIWVMDSAGRGGGEPSLKPTDAPADAALVFSYDDGYRGALNRMMSRSSGIDKYDTWVTPDGLLTVRPVFAESSTASAPAG